jgi:hypothetical protein
LATYRAIILLALLLLLLVYWRYPAARKLDIKAIDCSLSDRCITPTSVTLSVQHKQSDMETASITEIAINGFQTAASLTAEKQQQHWLVRYTCIMWVWYLAAIAEGNMK